MCRCGERDGMGLGVSSSLRSYVEALVDDRRDGFDLSAQFLFYLVQIESVFISD